MQGNFGSWTISIKREAFSLDELATKYNDLSPTWDATISRLGFDKAYQNLFTIPKIQAKLAQLETDAQVLDAGIGTGALSYAMASHHQQTFQLHGMDISDKMLEQAHKNLTQIGILPMLQTGNANDLPYDDAQFDWTMTAHMLEHLDNPVDGLGELVRVTKSGGKLLIIMTRESLFGNYIDAKWRLNRLSEQKLESAMKEYGLGKIEFHRFPSPIWANWFSMVVTAEKA